MFEKEAEEYVNNNFYNLIEEVQEVAKVTFKDGAEFGYNKDNEWHYVKDGDLPKECENVLINALDYGINTCYVAHRINGKWRSNCSSGTFVRVIRWKEIVLPELKGGELTKRKGRKYPLSTICTK